MLRRITHHSDIINAVVSLVSQHMKPLQLVTQHAKMSAYKRLANKLSNSISIKLLTDLIDADKRGRNGQSHEPLPGPNEEVTLFIEKAKKAGIFERKEAPILTGTDLLNYVQPGPQMGKLLDQAYNIQINEGIIDKHILLKRVLKKDVS